MTSVLFVCLGNICRSPLAEGVFRDAVHKAGLTDHIHIDSAGTGAWHAGNPPDPRSIEVAAKYGIDISRQRARQVIAEDFNRFDLILAMDTENLETLYSRSQLDHPGLRLFLNDPAKNVPDPYYGGEDGFEQVYQLIDQGSHALLTTITKHM
ncbi:low molecular weight protein-tyrosine-phosphatase [Labrenzia sp. PHM005]|uniref:low molecular weight protein-tyrosine-phosphatase n=1 Tax=Labrenzia sp. PHM005 TaxID=2590016 RepID=UPI00114090F2|nr:low molecular weight protein-tyrosine-phosphatase [Labrenzia sp. PHM005]QDG75467.1 low molecular weight phosphotyrosine protein phosphatase [Labrenzia sp. PHM005]